MRFHSRQVRAFRSLRIEPLEWRNLLAASLQINATLNGLPSDTSPGPSVDPGTALIWSLDVTNTGDAPVKDVSLSNDNGTPGNTADDETLTPSVSPTPAFGSLVKTFSNLPATKFVVDTQRHLMYVTMRSANSVAIINTVTLQLEKTVVIGSMPQGLALSNDGSRLYVANVGSQFVAVLDTVTRTTLPSLLMPSAPIDVEVGADGRLFVSTSNAILQRDAITGQSVGPNLGPSLTVIGGELEMSPAKDRLYYANQASSPARLYQFDTTTNPPTLLWQTPTNAASSGQGVEVSSDGSVVAHISVIGPGGYAISTYRASDMAVLGSFPTGAYPQEAVFSHDDAVTYTVHTANKIESWDTASFLAQGTITTNSATEVSELFVSPSGKYLFAAVGTELRVYGTGRGGPFNVGDLNENGLLDAGEAFRFQSSGTVQAGAHAHQFQATATEGFEPVSATVTAYYQGALPATAVSPLEKISGLEIATITIPAGVDGSTLVANNSRFEVRNNKLWLKAAEYLTRSSDDGMLVAVQTPGAQPVVVERFALSVLANVFAWNNADQPADVEGDGDTDIQDALAVIRDIRRNGFRDLGARPATITIKCDVTADNRLDISDALAVIRRIRQQGAGEGEASLSQESPATSGTASDIALQWLLTDAGSGFPTKRRA